MKVKSFYGVCLQGSNRQVCVKFKDFSKIFFFFFFHLFLLFSIILLQLTEGYPAIHTVHTFMSTLKQYSP